MRCQPRRPLLGDLLHLRQQLAADRAQAPETLRERDHAIGQQCRHSDKLQSLLCWLQRVRGEEAGSIYRAQEKHWALLLRVLALLLGAAGMAGFLLASERALVNVLLFLLIFVVAQLLFCLLAAWMTVSALRGMPGPAVSLAPARLIVQRVLPDGQFQREAGVLSRLLLLRYGQEIAALFALGAVLAFLVLLAVLDFSFVWGSTFAISDEVVRTLTGALSAPWSLVFPAASVPPEVISGTRFHPAQLDLGAMAAASRRGWWPFLFACLLFYTLLPRLLLWLLCLWGYRRQLHASLLAWPGVSSVLARMRAPVVDTRAADRPVPPVVGDGFAAAALLDWAGTLASVEPRLRAALAGHTVHAAGLGSPADDVAAIDAVNALGPEQLLVAVRGWEPPMADLADVLGEIAGVRECTLLLAALPGRELSDTRLADWQRFAAGLPFTRSRVQLLDGSAA